MNMNDIIIIVIVIIIIITGLMHPGHVIQAHN